jgi:hypothetical protein
MRRFVLVVATAVAAVALTASALNLSLDDLRPDHPTPSRAALPASPRGLGQSTLQGVTVLSARSAWAVGGRNVRLGGWTGGEVVSASPLIEYWNGTRWSVVSTPKARGLLTDVAATSRRDAWAVGAAPGSRAPLILHWNGRRWSRTSSRLRFEPRSVASISPADVWVVGTSGSGAEIAHWDGKRWTRALALGNASLEDVTAISRGDVWAVGSITATSGRQRTLLLHWDGVRWRSFSATATDGFDDAWLLAIAGTSANDVWAGGGEHMAEMSPPAIGPLMLHWNGTRWSHARLEDSGETEFVAIAALSGGGACAVSGNSWSYELQGSFGFGVWRLAGSRWQATELPYGRELYDIAAVPTSTRSGRLTWAVGQIGTDIQDYATHTVPLLRRLRC